MLPWPNVVLVVRLFQWTLLNVLNVEFRFSGVSDEALGECGACNASMHLDSTKCPECGVVFVADDVVDILRTWMANNKMDVKMLFGRFDTNNDNMIDSGELKRRFAVIESCRSSTISSRATWSKPSMKTAIASSILKNFKPLLEEELDDEIMEEDHQVEYKPRVQ